MNNMFTHLTENYEACVAVILFAIGMCMLLFDKNLLKKVIGLDIMDSGTFLLLADGQRVGADAEPDHPHL